MPRGRKRKAPTEGPGESSEDGMDEAMDTLPADDSEQPDQETGAEVADEVPIDAQAEAPEEEGEMPSEDVEPGEVVTENNDCPPAEELKKLKAQAQEDITHLDVLICGKCHNAFHMIEEFVEHKESCLGNSTIISATTKSDNKPQVWAFVLYKAFKMRETGDTKDMNERSWLLYQKWSGLDEHLKATWVQAGKALMGLQQYSVPAKKMPHRLTTTEEHKKTLIQLQKELEDDPDPVVTPRGRPPKDAAKRLKKDADEDTESHVASPHITDRGEIRKRAGTNQIWRKSQRKGADETETELYTVEKIVAKRANPKLKSAEYLVKWAGLSSDNNSWEHASNLLTCKPIVEEFERNLAKQKARKAAEAQRLLEKQTAMQNAGGRPVRTSALKAMDQVKEWVGSKHDADVDDEEFTLVTTSGGNQVLKKRIFSSPSKNTVLMANSKGMMKLDQNHMANLSSGVYIISDQSGLVKVEDRAASKLSSALDVDGHTVGNNRSTMMINETEVRKVTANNKFATFRKDASGLIKKENSVPFSNLIQKRTIQSTAKASPRQVVQQYRTRPQAGQIASPLRTTNQRTQKQTLLGRGQQKVMRILDEDDSILTNEDGSICSIGGSILGRDETDPLLEEGDESAMAEVDDDGLMRVAISPGGSLHHIVQQRPKQHVIQTEQQITQDQDMMQIEGEDGVIYNLTPEQQQMLMQNGTLTVDAKHEPLEEHTEMVIENGQIVRRLIGTDADGEEGTFMLAGDGIEGVKVEQEGEMDEESMLTLQSAVQEAVQGTRVQLATEEGNMDATLVQAEPLEPGSTMRKVVLQTADGTLFATEMDEEQYQSLGIDKVIDGLPRWEKSRFLLPLPLRQPLMHLMGHATSNVPVTVVQAYIEVAIGSYY